MGADTELNKVAQEILSNTYTLQDGEKRLEFRIPELTAAQVDTIADMQRLIMTKYKGKLGQFLQDKFIDFAEYVLVRKEYTGFWTPEEGKAVRKALEEYISKYKGLPLSFMQGVFVDFFACNLRSLTGFLLYSEGMNKALKEIQQGIKSSVGGNISRKSRTAK